MTLGDAVREYNTDINVSDVVGQSPVATIVYDVGGRPVYVNPAFRKLWGIDESARLPGYSLWSDHQFTGSGLSDSFRRAFAGESVAVDPVEYDMSRLVGGAARSLWVQGYLYPLRDSDGVVTHVVAVQEDVTTRMSTEEELRARAVKARRLQRLANDLAHALTRTEVSDVLARQGSRALGTRSGVVAIAAGEAVEFLGWTGYSGVDRGRWQRIPTDYPSPLTDAIRDGVPIWVSSVDELAERWPDYASRHGIRNAGAWGVVPLLLPTGEKTTRTLGALGVTYPAPPEKWPEIQQLAAEIAEIGARALERAHLYELAESARQEADVARREAEDARRRAEYASNAKSEFLATMSHELRTPLNAIAGYTELLEMGVQGPMNDAQKESLARIRRSQEHLLGLINSILNLAKIEAGRVEYLLADVPAAEMLAQIEQFVRPLVVEKSLDYECRECAETILVRADPEKVIQILLNLVSNAIKFTQPGGSIAIEAAVIDRTRVALTVRDTGIGIPENKLPMIFDRFVQLDSRFTRESSGTGLGLAISRDLARAMGGDLVARSREGEGSEFILVLPSPA